MPETIAEIHTRRLLMRPWRADDLEPFAAMNADARVMEHFPALLSRIESNAVVERIRKHWSDFGFGLWALEVPNTASFIGFAGLSRPSFSTPFTPCVEVGWRLAAAHWQQGYATEAARAAVRIGFLTLGLSEIVSFTVPANARSRRVMEKLSMLREPGEDFDHPRVELNSPLRRHVLYRLTRDRWANTHGPEDRAFRTLQGKAG